ncbi:MAG TPA: hemerythrin domain-containing protein [Steroidobacteraceae bacterium]|nr:hemerythrin domain-containing protein [Steroidobacteraceae bacterium]
MNSIVAKASPSITSMIRMDHTHVMAAFHRYKSDTSPARKQAIVEHICLALTVHAQLEEEIFYPALQSVLQGDEVLNHSKPEHDEMRGYIDKLRGMSPEEDAFDDTLMDLMRVVIHHVADEETRLLPAAERLLGDQLGSLGAQMTKRRMELLGPHAGEIVRTGARTFPAGAAIAIGGALAIGAMLFAKTKSNSSRVRWTR